MKVLQLLPDEPVMIYLNGGVDEELARPACALIGGFLYQRREIKKNKRHMDSTAGKDFAPIIVIGGGDGVSWH